LEKSGVTQQELETYSKNEVIKRCIGDVRERADHQKEVRMSPRKFYGGVKSKVAGNMNTINNSRKTKRLGEPSPDRGEFIKKEVETMFRHESPTRAAVSHNF